MWVLFGIIAQMEHWGSTVWFPRSMGPLLRWMRRTLFRRNNKSTSNIGPWRPDFPAWQDRVVARLRRPRPPRARTTVGLAVGARADCTSSLVRSPRLCLRVRVFQGASCSGQLGILAFAEIESFEEEEEEEEGEGVTPIIPSCLTHAIHPFILLNPATHPAILVFSLSSLISSRSHLLPLARQ